MKSNNPNNFTNNRNTTFFLDGVARSVGKKATRVQQNNVASNKKTYGHASSKVYVSPALRDMPKSLTSFERKQMKKFLSLLKKGKENISSPERMKDMLQRMQRLSSSPEQYTKPVAQGSVAGTTYAQFKNQQEKKSDSVQQIVDGMCDAAAGKVGFGDFSPIVPKSTMLVARDLASGKINEQGGVVQGILSSRSGTGAAIGGQVGSQAGGQAGSAIGAAYGGPIGAAVGQCIGEKVGESVGEAVGEKIESSLSQDGIGSIQSIIGSDNGATELLTASVNNLQDRTVAKMMQKIMDMVETAHGYTHPLFAAIFPMTWDQNGQWDEFHGVKKGSWMDIITELVEYFDFVQAVFGGAINEVFKGGQAMFEQVSDIACQASDQIIETANSACDGTMNSSSSVSVSFPVPPLSVPLMSISKQVEDIMQKIMVIKETIRAKAKLILARLKSLQGMELFINMPEDFFLILAVLVEAEFIYSNLPIVMDKILEFMLNMFVEKFAGIAAGIIAQLFEIWEKVIEIVPPLDDLLKLAWAIPNAADCCFNAAVNIALPQMYGIIQPFIDMPFDALDMISSMCDVATNALYTPPPP